MAEIRAGIEQGELASVRARWLPQAEAATGDAS
jgi:hypothetical protein